MINNKSIYYRKWKAGELGNRIRMWSHIYHLMNDDSYSGNVNIRHAVPASPYSLWNIPKKEAYSTLDKHCKKYSLRLDQFQLNEPTPDEELLIQGEIVDHVEMYLAYNTDKVLMREAMKTAKTVSGLIAKETLKYYCDYESYNSLMDLMTEYPNHTIEFGVYSRNLGFIPRRNTIIWEVRLY